MPWSSLGSVLLDNWEWKIFPTPVVGDVVQVYKVKQSFRQGLIYPEGYFLLGFLGRDLGKYGLRRIYFDTQFETTFTYKLPNELFNIAAVRDPIAKLPRRSRIDDNNLPVIELFEFL